MGGVLLGFALGAMAFTVSANDKMKENAEEKM